MPTAKQVVAAWVKLYPDLVVLQAIKRTDPKRYNTIRIQLRDLVDDIADALRDISLAPRDVDVLVDTLKKAKNYQQIFEKD